MNPTLSVRISSSCESAGCGLHGRFTKKQPEGPEAQSASDNLIIFGIVIRRTPVGGHCVTSASL